MLYHKACHQHIGPLDQKKVPDIIDFEIIKGIARTYFPIKASLEFATVFFYYNIIILYIYYNILL